LIHVPVEEVIVLVPVLVLVEVDVTVVVAVSVPVVVTIIAIGVSVAVFVLVLVPRVVNTSPRTVTVVVFTALLGTSIEVVGTTGVSSVL
jgi:hypothetical protein